MLAPKLAIRRRAFAVRVAATLRGIFLPAFLATITSNDSIESSFFDAMKAWRPGAALFPVVSKHPAVFLRSEV